MEPEEDGCTQELYEEHMVGMYKALVYLKTIDKPSEEEIAKKRVPLPRLEDKSKKRLHSRKENTCVRSR